MKFQNHKTTESQSHKITKVKSRLLMKLCEELTKAEEELNFIFYRKDEGISY